MKEAKEWKTLTNIEFANGAEGVAILLDKGYRLSEWVQDIFARDLNKEIKFKYPIKLARVTVSSLGFDEPTTLLKIYNSLPIHGLGLVSPVIALACRLDYPEQPTGEWLRFATPMKSMIDSDGIPHLPKLGKALGLYFVETYWAYEHAIFHPHNEFVVELNH